MGDGSVERVPSQRLDRRTASVATVRQRSTDVGEQHKVGETTGVPKPLLTNRPNGGTFLTMLHNKAICHLHLTDQTMKPLAPLLLLTAFFSSLAYADSAATVAPLPFDDFKRIAGDRVVTIDESAKEVILEFASELDEMSPQIAAVVDAVRGHAKSVSLQALMPFLEPENGQSVSQNMAQHDDPVVRFVASIILSASGDSEASKTVYALIHDESIPLIDKRLIRTWCNGVGIRVATDDADKIFAHLTTAMSGKPKFGKGDAAPQFETTTTKGGRISLRKLRGKVLVLHFWSTTCAPCMGQMPSHINSLSQYHPDEVEIVFVSLDHDKDAFESAVSKFGMKFHNVRESSGWGGNLTRTFGVNSMPFDIVVGRDGKVFSNSIDDIDAALAAESTPSQNDGRTNR